jgi:phospholipase/carboxylesterase
MHTALRSSHRLGGLIALSTYLPLSDQLPQDAHEANRNLAIFIAHGSFDEVISLQTGKASALALEQHGYVICWHEYPMAHSVCQQELLDIRDFLNSVLGIE